MPRPYQDLRDRSVWSAVFDSTKLLGLIVVIILVPNVVSARAGEK